jgi:hypothetical protein
MKRALKIIAIVLFVAFVAIQFIRPDFTNPPIEAAKTLEATAQVPADVEAILTRSCTDCHSNATVYPWYSNIQPSAWFLADHIKEGRRELNFSEWGTYNDKRKKRKLEEICEQVETKEMPLPSYLWIHRGARLSDDEIKKICDWTKSESAKLPIAEPQNEPNK